MATPHPPGERVAQLAWTAFILLFFLIQAVIWTVAITFTARDQSHAVVMNYDEQALNWDEVKQRHFDSDKLGWSATVEVAPAADDPIAKIRGERKLRLHVVDSRGKPVKHATLQLDAFHRGQAAVVQQVTLTPDISQPGVYEGQVQIRKPGIWKFVGSAKRGADNFLIDEQQFVSSTDPH